ncbi:hypothetical protein [Rheinheimera sp.]|uniref:hypothetical protein n=1 Tax=Rheinheimera sp. TaxID=1869214 RepID=UPI0040488543
MSKSSFFEDDQFPGESAAERLAHVVSTRDGSDISDRMNISDPIIDLHQVVHALTPGEILEAVNMITETTRFKLQANTFTHSISADFWYAKALIETATPQYAWDENSATEDILISLTLSNIRFNDPQKINRLNFNYPTLQVFMSDNGHLIVRTHQTLKGGRSLENLLWTVIHLFHDAERLYKDISVFEVC